MGFRLEARSRNLDPQPEIAWNLASRVACLHFWIWASDSRPSMWMIAEPYKDFGTGFESIDLRCKTTGTTRKLTGNHQQNQPGAKEWQESVLKAATLPSLPARYHLTVHLLVHVILSGKNPYLIPMQQLYKPTRSYINPM